MGKGLRILGLGLAGLAVAAFAIPIFSAASNASRPGDVLSRTIDDRQELSCPKTDNGEGESTTRKNARSRHIVVPKGSETVLLCRYFGLGHTQESQARQGKLESTRLIERRSFVRLLAREFNDFRPMHGTYSCPVTGEGHINALFGYPAEPTVVVEASFSGCWTAYNGFRQGGWINLQLARRLMHLTKS
jgi:hypothetical protein